MNRESIKMYWRIKSEHAWMWIAARLPGRLLYFACLQALGRVSQTERYRRTEVGKISAMTVIKVLEEAYE